MKQSLELAEKLIRQSYLEKNEYIELLSAYKDEETVVCLGQEDLMAYISEKSDVYKPYLVTTKKEM